jgi:hypothetical protein
MEGQPALRHGGLGVTSFVMSVVVLVLIVVLFGVAGAMKAAGTATPATNVVVGLAIIVLWVLDLVAIALGIAGAIDNTSKKVFPILGLVLAVGTAVISAGLVVIGMHMAE